MVPILLGLLVVSVVLAVGGITLWPLGILCWLLSTSLLAPRFGWVLAFVGALAALVAAETVLLRLVPPLNIDLATSHEVVWGVVAAGLIVALSARWPKMPLPSRDGVRVALAAVAAPAVAGVAVLVAAIASRSTLISWSMRNDAVWTTFSAQHIATDGGIDALTHPDPSPLMSALMAVGSAPGRAQVPASDQLHFDIVRDGQLWILIILLTSLVIGLIVARAVGPGRPVARFVAVFIMGCLPFSWYVSGFATYFGFYSASLAILLLICVWVVWQRAAAHPVAAFTVLILLSTDLLATWALLVTVPLAFAAVIFVRNFRPFFGWARPGRLVIWFASVLLLAGYGVMVSAPDFIVENSALAQGGAIQRMPPWILALAAVVALGTTWVVGRRNRRFSEFIGVLAITVGVAVGLAVLLVTGKSGWSYYPTKLGWLAIILYLVIIGAMLAQLIRTGVRRHRREFVTVVVSLALLVGIAVARPPLPHSFAAVSPYLEAVTDSARHDAYAGLLFSVSEPGQKVLLSRYASAAEDKYVNGWLLQSTSQRGTEAIRYYSYFMDPTNATQVCAAIKSWGKGVIVETRDPGWGAQLHASCPAEKFTVRLRQ